MDFKKRFKRNENIVYREEDEGAFLFDPDTGDLKYMNQSGKEAFLVLSGDYDINHVIHHMLELYPEVGLKQIQKDLEEFIEDLEKNHFILQFNRE